MGLEHLCACFHVRLEYPGYASELNVYIWLRESRVEREEQDISTCLDKRQLARLVAEQGQ